MNRDVCEHFNPVDLPCDKCRSANVQKSMLREAAQQALEAMESAEVDPHSSDAIHKAITALKAALVEDALQKFSDVNQELEAALAEDIVTHGNAWSKDGKRIDPMSVYAEPKQDGCDHCNHPMYVAIKCRVCGRVTEPQRKPLSEDEALDIARTFGAQPWPPGSCVAFARAVERAHGIGGET